ncbi:C39 family peptidase [Diplocloster hominis]|uniref:C39 family peptidase n=1 Tax=Diplocloster hominis TaxID=3079010 RepID=UPI0031BBBB4C
MIKKSILLLISVVLTLAFNINIYATESDSINGDLTIEEGAQPYNPTQADLNKIAQKDRSIYQQAKTNEELLSMICYRQENNYYCGPATVKQVVQYKNGNSNIQSYYAGLLNTVETGDNRGTDMTRIAPVINSCIGSSYYVMAEIPGDSLTWFNRIRTGISAHYPTVLDINTNSVSEFPYKTSGHYICTSGFRVAENQVRIADPHPSYFGHYWYSRNGLYKANADHFRHAMIY